MSTHCARSAENTPTSLDQCTGSSQWSFLIMASHSLFMKDVGGWTCGDAPSIKKFPSLTSKDIWSRKAQKLQPSWDKPGMIPKHDTKAHTESLKANIFRIHFSISCHLSTNYLWPGSCLPRRYKTPPTDATREIFRGNCHKQPHSHKEQCRQRHCKSHPEHFMHTYPKQLPSPWSALPLLSPRLQRDGPWQRLLCTVCRALGVSEQLRQRNQTAAEFLTISA